MVSSRRVIILPPTFPEPPCDAKICSAFDAVRFIESHMEFDLQGQHASRAYSLLASIVMPRPIAWITTVGEDGVVNAAPFSFFNVLGANPPIVGFAPSDRADGSPKDTARNIRLNHEFVVNLVDESLAQAMCQSSAALPYGVSELAAIGLATAPSSLVRPPRIAAAPASLECSEWGTLRIGNNHLMIGLVKRLHVREEFVDQENQRIRPAGLKIIGRMASPDWYCRTTDRFEMKHPD